MPITKLIWNMSLPIIASMLVQALYNIVDSWFVSRVSEQALTAVSLAFPAQNLMIGLATGTAVGVNALMGRALGAGLRERADKVANNGVFLAVVGFVISALLGLTCSDLFFRSQTQVESIIQMGNDYLRIVTMARRVCSARSCTNGSCRAPGGLSSACTHRGWALSSTSFSTPSSSSD